MFVSVRSMSPVLELGDFQEVRIIKVIVLP